MKELIDGSFVEPELYYSLLEYKDQNRNFLWDLFRIQSVCELNKDQFEKAIMAMFFQKLNFNKKPKNEKEDLVKGLLDLKFLEISNNYKSGIKQPRAFYELFEATSSVSKNIKRPFGKTETNKILFQRKQDLNGPEFKWFYGFGHKNSLTFQVVKDDNIRRLENFANNVRNLHDVREEEKEKYSKLKNI